MSLAARSAAKGNPVATLAPKEGPVLILSPSAIMANTRHPNASKLFMEWLLGSEDTEQITIEEFGVPLRVGAKSRARRARAGRGQPAAGADADRHGRRASRR